MLRGVQSPLNVHGRKDPEIPLTTIAFRTSANNKSDIFETITLAQVSDST
jgi:hypothetical protein